MRHEQNGEKLYWPFSKNNKGSRQKCTNLLTEPGK